MNMIRLFLFGTLGFSLSANAKILRSAALYFAPNQQIETNAIATYGTTESQYGLFQTDTAVTTLGGRIEHGFTEQLSWGAALRYGMGTKEIKTTFTQIKDTYDGLLDPEVYLKSHFETEKLRFHVGGILGFKSDAMVMSYDRSPMNFSQGGSSLVMQLGLEGAIGPTLLGAEVTGDLWKDFQEVVIQNTDKTDTIYFREGGKAISLTTFGELNNSRWIKPGLKVQLTQIEPSRAEIQENQRVTTNTIQKFQMPREQQLGGSFYGRIRLPKHFVLTLELYGKEARDLVASDTPRRQSYGVATGLGFKF
jgi:hypothetical protein